VTRNPFAVVILYTMPTWRAGADRIVQRAAHKRDTGSGFGRRGRDISFNVKTLGQAKNLIKRVAAAMKPYGLGFQAEVWADDLVVFKMRVKKGPKPKTDLYGAIFKKRTSKRKRSSRRTSRRRA